MLTPAAFDILFTVLLRLKAIQIALALHAGSLGFFYVTAGFLSFNIIFLILAGFASGGPVPPNTNCPPRRKQCGGR